MNTAAVRKKLVERDGHNCHICRQPIFAVPTNGNVKSHEMTIDHIVPLAKGGTNDLENLRLAHQSCNQKRGSRPTSDDAMYYRFMFTLFGYRVKLYLQPQRVFELYVAPAPNETKG